MNKISRAARLAPVLTAFLFIFSSASLRAMPNFARKTGMPCSGCHTVIPRLNEFGYKYRVAGFRLPDDIGK